MTVSVPGRPYYRDRTVQAWLDENDHVNVRFYFRLVARGLRRFQEETRPDGASPAQPPPLSPRRVRMLYRAELRVDQEVAVRVLPLRGAPGLTRLAVFVERLAPDPALTAECIVEGPSVGPALGEEGALARTGGEAAQAYEEPPSRRVEPLPEIAPERRVTTHQGHVEGAWVGPSGEVELEEYNAIFYHGNRGYMEALGLSRPLMGRLGIGKFVLETNIVFQASLAVGEPYRLISRMIGLGRKTAQYCHELWAGAPEPKLCAACRQTMALVDRRTRRTIELPAWFRRAVADRHGLPA